MPPGSPTGLWHQGQTETYLIISGSGTLVTGGKVVNGRKSSPTSEVTKVLNGPSCSGSIVGDAITWTLVRNSGAAFSMATGYTWVLTLIATGVVIGIIWMGRRLVSPWWAIGLGMLLGGAMGNLVDRFFRSPGPLRGHVVDFLSIGWWPVFNVADPSVVGGAILLVALSLFGFDFDTVGRRKAKARAYAHFRELDEVRGDLDTALGAGLAQLGLPHGLHLIVDVRRPKKR